MVGLAQLAGGAVDRFPVFCGYRFAASGVSTGLRLLQPVGEVFLSG